MHPLYRKGRFLTTGPPGKSQAPLLDTTTLRDVNIQIIAMTLEGFPGGSAGKESTCNAGDLDSIPGLGRSPGERNGYLLQCSGLENSTDCITHGVTKNRA